MPATALDLMDSLAIAEAVNREDAKIAAAINKVLPEIARAINTVADALRGGGKLGYFGAGTSGKIAILDATDCPQTFGIDESRFVFDVVDIIDTHRYAIYPHDIVYGIGKSKPKVF